MQRCTRDFNQERTVCKKNSPLEKTYYKIHSGKYRHGTTNWFMTPETAAEGVDQQGRKALYLALRLINSHRILQI